MTAIQTGGRIPKFTKFFYPFSGIFRDACYALVGTFLLQYTMFSGVLSSDSATFTAQMNVITVALICALIWDGFNDPIMGILVEKCRFKAGKFKPWILMGAIGNSIVVALMFSVRIPGDGWGYVAFMIIAYFLWDVFFTMNDIGYWSMLPSLTSDPKERNSLTTVVTLATTVGAFAMNLVCFIIPGLLPNVSTASFYMVTAIIAAALFLASQVILYFFCQERARDRQQEKVSEKTRFKDLFIILWRNKQLLIVVIAIFFYYLASTLLTAIGLNYFYFAYGYGGSRGGFLASALSVVFVIATVLAQSLFPLLAKKIKKQTLLAIMVGIAIAGYIVFLLIGFPLFGEHPLAWSSSTSSNAVEWLFTGTLATLFIPAFFFFGAQGIIYLILMVMMQNAIEYNEYAFGERKESVAFSWRPLTAKFASALQKGVMNLTFIVSSLYFSAVVPISNLENALDSHGISQEAFDSQVAQIVSAIKPGQLTAVGFIIIGCCVVSLIVVWALIRFGYKIDEAEYDRIVEELDKRHAAEKA